MIWVALAVWIFLAMGMLWNNIYRSYTVGVYKWLAKTVLPQLRDNPEWSIEADELQFDVLIDIDTHINHSFAFLLPLVIVLAINSAFVLNAFGDVYVEWLNVQMAFCNAACAIGFLELRKRYYWARAQVKAYKVLLNAEEIHTESLKNDEG